MNSSQLTILLCVSSVFFLASPQRIVAGLCLTDRACHLKKNSCHIPLSYDSMPDTQDCCAKVLYKRNTGFNRKLKRNHMSTLLGPRLVSLWLLW